MRGQGIVDLLDAVGSMQIHVGASDRQSRREMPLRCQTLVAGDVHDHVTNK